MKHLISLALALAVAQATPTERSDVCVLGIDTSRPVDWAAAAKSGIKFASIMATDGSSQVSPTFCEEYDGATKAGLLRAAYHFARPDESSGADQANLFLAHGGGWSPDGITLPGVLGIEYNFSGPECWGLSASELVSWIKDFSDTYKDKTGRCPVIYTVTDWWKTCTENSPAFGHENPLWIVNHASTIGPLPAGWEHASFWQYADPSPYGDDADRWNGDYDCLKKFACGA